MWYKRTIPLILVFVLGLLAFAQNYIPHPFSDKFLETVTDWSRIIGGFGLFIGMYSLLSLHVHRIRRGQPGWAYSAFVFIGAAGMIILGLWNDGVGPLRAAPDTQDTWFAWGYENVQVPCSAALFSILAFYMASAAFRTFRARNVGAALLLVSALIVMFGRVTVSETVGVWVNAASFNLIPATVFGDITDAIMKYPNMAAKRGVILGVALGAIAQSLRIIFGIERSYLGGGD